MAVALFAVGCGNTSTTETGSGAGSPTAQGPVEPLTAVGPLECGDREVVGDRIANDGQDPTELAMTYHPDVERVEPGDPLFWEAFDANDDVVVLMATSDDDVADWQIWTCG